MVKEKITTGYASDTVVISSPTDRRLYRILHLPNGLTVLLVHDPEIFPDGDLDASRTKERNVDDDDDYEEDESEDDVDDESDEDDDEDDDDDEDEDEDDDEDDDDGEENEGDRRRKKKSGDFPTKKAAAALCVGMGSFSDPVDAQGLAHFLEHMLFMGSSEFPDENEYDSYLSKHGGMSNAYTETEYTCYHFEVNREYLKGALQRFSQFFIAPLVKSEAMEREVLAVDSEFNQALQSDSCRTMQLQCHTSLPDHPFNRFFWGNKKSLSDATGRGVNLREEILRLYRENYHGGKMKLVIIGGESLDTLENWAFDLFGNVKNGVKNELFHDVKVNGIHDMPIWKPAKLYRIAAVKDAHVLDLSWTLPCLRKEYLKKPEDYLSHLLGHEGRGSLLFFLKAKGWASSLSTGVGNEGMFRSSFAYVFFMSINLTDSGLDELYVVIEVVYQYIKLLRETAPQEWIFKELQDIGKLEFRFAEEQPQDDYASSLAENLLFYSEEHIIYGEYAYEQWDGKLIEHILGYFSPDNMRLDVLSKSFDKESPVVQFEPWFGTQYIEEDVSGSLLELWKNPPCVDPSLHLPAKNDFIPRDFSLNRTGISKILEGGNQPNCIVENPSLMIWYKPDLTFNIPRANAYFLISVKDGYSSVKNCVLTELFVTLLKDELNDIIYQASVAKLDTSLSIVGDKLVLKVYGFNDKLSVLLSKILTLSKSFLPKTDRFKVIKEVMERSYRNTNMKPLNHSTYLRLQLLREHFWDVDDKLACLSSISLADVVTFIPQLLSQLHIEGICHGNLCQEMAINISDIFTTVFPAKPLPMELRHQERVLCLPSGATFVRTMSVKNDSEVNSVAELYFQIEQDAGIDSIRLSAISDLFSTIIEEPCFNQLRTKEQLGYVVESDTRMTYRVVGFCFRVQSSEYDPLHLHERINNFINDVKDLLDGVDDEAFENYKTGLIEEKLEKDPSLLYETDRYWNQIVDKRYLFDMPKKEAEELKAMKKGDVIDWYNTYLRQPSPKCRQLAIHIWGCNSNMKEKSIKESKFGNIIEDISSLKLSSGFYPSLC